MEEAQSMIQMVDMATIQLNTTGTTFQEREREGGLTVSDLPQSIAALFLYGFGVTTMYCSLQRDHTPRVVSAKDMDMRWGCVHGA